VRNVLLRKMTAEDIGSQIEVLRSFVLTLSQALSIILCPQVRASFTFSI